MKKNPLSAWHLLTNFFMSMHNKMPQNMLNFSILFKLAHHNRCLVQLVQFWSYASSGVGWGLWDSCEFCSANLSCSTFNSSSDSSTAGKMTSRWSCNEATPCSWHDPNWLKRSAIKIRNLFGKQLVLDRRIRFLFLPWAKNLDSCTHGWLLNLGMRQANL